MVKPTLALLKELIQLYHRRCCKTIEEQDVELARLKEENAILRFRIELQEGEIQHLTLRKYDD